MKHRFTHSTNLSWHLVSRLNTSNGRSYEEGDKKKIMQGQDHAVYLGVHFIKTIQKTTFANILLSKQVWSTDPVFLFFPFIHVVLDKRHFITSDCYFKCNRTELSGKISFVLLSVITRALAFTSRGINCRFAFLTNLNRIHPNTTELNHTHPNSTELNRSNPAWPEKNPYYTKSRRQGWRANVRIPRAMLWLESDGRQIFCNFIKDLPKPAVVPRLS